MSDRSFPTFILHFVHSMRSCCYLLLLVSSATIAQPGKEANHWHFSHQLGLDFSSGVPVPDSSAMHTVEGSASISDPNTGSLLFYTDGDTIWTKNNAVMQNGTGLIGGDGTCSQAAIILQQPYKSNLYFVFTADQGGYGYGANKGVFYSIVDMNQNGGMGRVVVKNICLTPPPTLEKLTAVQHCNGHDYWIITHSFLSNAYNAYKLDSSGVSPAVVSQVGFVELNNGGTFDETIGCMKASPDGKKLALCISYYEPSIEIADFDNYTGRVSNPYRITYTGNPSPYGLSFSPDNTKLYVSFIYARQILQYDFSAGSQAEVIASEKVIASGRSFSGVQLGPDGKIYVVDSTNSLGVIHDPDQDGTGSNYQYSAISFQKGQCELGLPNFVDGVRESVSTAFVFPNVVTPNGDNVNDEIDLGRYSMQTVQLDIFNRWGTPIFSCENTVGSWKPACSDGTYYYTLRYIQSCASENKTAKGFITVIR